MDSGKVAKGIRFNKYLAMCGVCSRRDADRMAKDGRVCVNGKAAAAGMQVFPGDIVEVDGKRVQAVPERAVLAFYKPPGVVCTARDPYATQMIAAYVDYPVRVTYAGRLDKNSEGLLLLTNDGELIDRLMRGANKHEKEYIVKVKEEITDAFLEALRNGIYLEELQKTTRPCVAAQIDKHTFDIVLTQGLNRQIRRMCGACGQEVLSIKRVRVMNIMLGGMLPGTYREVTGSEKAALYAAVGLEENRLVQ